MNVCLETKQISFQWKWFTRKNDFVFVPVVKGVDNSDLKSFKISISKTSTVSLASVGSWRRGADHVVGDRRYRCILRCSTRRVTHPKINPLRG